MPMETEMNPFVRFLVIAVLVLTPIAVIILQRLSEVKEVIQRVKQGERLLGPDLPFTQNNARDIKVCPKCIAINPPENRFCGQCGAALIDDASGGIGRDRDEH